MEGSLFLRGIAMVRYKAHFKPRRRLVLSYGERTAIKVIFIAAVAAAVLMLAYRQVKPILREFLLSETENLTYYRINRAVEENINAENITYDDLVVLEKDENGRISAIKTNMRKMNTLMTKTSADIYNDLLYDDIIRINIPIGNLTGIELLSGLGPKITFRVVPINSVFAEFKNVFDSAGVNQTRHQIMLKFSVPLRMMLPGSEQINVFVEICVAETIIVGATPQFYAGLNQ
jgi:sporulation protein YunB